MADARLLHKKGSHGERVIALGHLEFRVWAQYVLSADDYGVMRASASVLRADNPRLEREPFKRIVAAMRAIEDVGLVQVFEHQGVLFWWQGDWQDFQGIRYPRDTVNPQPPSERIATATPKTQGLFGLRAKTSREDYGNISETSPTPARAGGRQTLTLTANTGSGSSERSYPDDFETFWRAYPNRTGKGAALKAWQKAKPDAAIVARMLESLAWQVNQPAWLRDGGQYVPHPATWLNRRSWEDEPFHPIGPEPFRKGRGALNAAAWDEAAAALEARRGERQGPTGRGAQMALDRQAGDD